MGTVEGGKVMLGVLSDGAKLATFSGLLEDDVVNGEWESDLLGDNGVWYGNLQPMKPDGQVTAE